MTNKNIESRTSWYLKCIAAFILTYCAFFIQYPQHVLNPNNQTFHKNGDLLVTHADLMYHVKYDSTSTFNGMNYPDPEYIYLTDANGAFATVYRWINNNVIQIDHILPGLTMSVMFLFLGFCGMFLFMIMRTMDVSSWLAMILAPLITLLAPQMARFVCHLSLSFPFVIPMIMLWTLRKYKVPKLEFVDLLFIGVTFFFFMNNAYIGFIMCMFAGVIGFVLFMLDFKAKMHRKAAIIMMVVPVLITITVYIILKLNDPYTDRLEEQWGFFYYHTKKHSFLFPRYSLVAGMMGKTFVNDFRSIEWGNNLGLVPMGLVGSYILHELLRIVKFKQWKTLLPKNTMMNVFLIASFLMVLFAANTTILPITEIIESYIDVILMFKSSGRFSWPFYFVIGVLSVRILQAWIKKLDLKKATYKWFLIVPLLLLFSFEVNYYLGQIFNKLDNENYLTGPQAEQTKATFAAAGINQDNYQALVGVPLLVGWNEKILIKVFNNTEQGALSVMAFTGIPMINGRLSRNSTSKTLEATQMSTHPLVKKTVLENLPNDKPILLIQGIGSDDWLSFGEKFLIDNAEEVFRTEKYIGYKTSVKKIQEIQQANVDYALNYIEKADSTSFDLLVRKGYDDQKTEVSLYGQGALKLEKGDSQILDFEHVFEQDSTALKFSTWTDITYKKYGMPEYHLSVYQDEKLIHKDIFISREYKNVYKNWIRSSFNLKVPKGKVNIKIMSRNNQTYWIDELQLNYKSVGPTIVDLGPEGYLIDNYLVEK